MKDGVTRKRRPQGLAKEILLGMLQDFHAIRAGYRDAKIFGRTRRPATHQHYQIILRRLRARGYVENGKSGPQLTPVGRKITETLLLSEALAPKHKNWDRRWRIIAFDIPEIYRKERALLRMFLHRSGFRKLQGSVWISPHDVLEQATKLWRKLGLTPYVRSAVVSWIDNERELKKQFNLP